MLIEILGGGLEFENALKLVGKLLGSLYQKAVDKFGKTSGGYDGTKPWGGIEQKMDIKSAMEAVSKASEAFRYDDPSVLKRESLRALNSVMRFGKEMPGNESTVSRIKQVLTNVARNANLLAQNNSIKGEWIPD